MTRLTLLDIRENQLSNLTLPADLNHLATLGLSGNKLTSLTLPPGLTNLTVIFVRFNQLTNLTLPPGLTHLDTLDAIGNQLGSVALPAGLTSLVNLFLGGNQLATLSLPPDMTQLTWLVLNGNPLATLVLSEPLAATNLAETVASLESLGVSVFTYPLAVQLLSPQQAAGGAFEFTLTGPPGVYTILTSPDLVAWSESGTATNTLGSAVFTDLATPTSPRKFYRTARTAP
jgi:hypothetical protein